MKIKDFMKIVGVILFIIIILSLINTIFNYMIIQDLQNKIDGYKMSTNYHIKSETTEPNGIIMTIHSYKKDNRQASILERNIDGEISKISQYGLTDKKGVRTYIESGDKKIASIDNEAGFIVHSVYNGVESDSPWNTFLASIFTYIRHDKIDNKECYVISNFNSPMNLVPEGGVEYYIDKDTGLLIKSVTNEQISFRTYEFDNVDNSIFEEPDISEFEIKEN